MSATVLEIAPMPSVEASRLAKLAPRPTTVAETGLSLSFLCDLLAKHLANAGVLRLSQLSERLALAGPVVEQVLQALRMEGRVEVRARLGGGSDLHFGLTERGRSDALDAMTRTGYIGPAPVPLDSYAQLVAKQSVHAGKVSRAAMHQAFRDVVIGERMLDQLGPALNSGRAIFIYGTAGTGKTFIAKRLARALPGIVLVPHAVAVNETVVEVFDPLAHSRVDLRGDRSPLMLEHGFDDRYVCCGRPIVVSGGELTSEMLEVHRDPATRRFHAPIQMKANCGLLLIDDLGRQRINPETLFNRWIVPLEERRDYLNAAGQHFTVPFDVVLIFSTNLDPQALADEAFLRRLGYKIAFRPVTTDQYRAIWQNACVERGVSCDSSVVDYVIGKLHVESGIPLLPCHPRDLLGMALERIAYLGTQEGLSQKTLFWAWNNYFVDSRGGKIR